MRFAGICLITHRVKVLADFYTAVLEVKAEGDDVHVTLKTDGAGMAIFSTAGMEGMAPHSTQGAGSGSCTLMFEVGNVDEEYGRLKALGVEFVKLPETHPWGSRSLWFKDPDGNVVDFFAPLAR